MNVAVVLAAVFSLVSPSARTNQLPPSNAFRALAGDYVEARTESVFAGACHINGEIMSTGRDAVMAWNFSNGARVMAVVSSPDNLANKSAARRSEIVVDPAAGQRATGAALAAVLSHNSAMLGKVVAIHQASIKFQDSSHNYKVECPGFASIETQALLDDSCCKQPNLVWFEPLTSLAHRKVGYTVNAQYTGGAIADTWQRSDENGAFYGTFAY